MYSDKVMLHIMNPHNMGDIENPSGVGVAGNPVCGDRMQIQIKVREGVLTEVKFKTLGCGADIATSSMVTDLATGKTIEEALKITRNDVAEGLEGLPPGKMQCSNRAADALHAAIEDHLRKEGRRDAPNRKKGTVKKKTRPKNGTSRQREN